MNGMKSCQANNGVPVMLAHFWFSLNGQKQIHSYLNICVFSAILQALLIPCCLYLVISSHIFALAPANGGRRTAGALFGLSHETDSVPDWPVEDNEM